MILFSKLFVLPLLTNHGAGYA